jgi:hypothetical protein
MTSSLRLALIPFQTVERGTTAATSELLLSNVHPSFTCSRHISIREDGNDGAP